MKDMNWLKNNNIAHRGLHTKKIPENSIDAFLNATKHGYDVELDLQLTKDKKIVIFHDNNLKRICGIDKRINEVPYSFLMPLTLKNSESNIPLFKNVLDVLPKSTHLMIELKTGKYNKELVSLFLEIIKEYEFEYVVQSFDPRIVRLIKKHLPNIPRGYIAKRKQVRSSILNFFISLLPIHTWIKPDYYVYKLEDLPNRKMDRMKSKGIMVLSYTAKSEKALKFMRERYDNAVFEGFNPTN
jgi:glycerophosphoryl diester phosphodiesterase